MNLHGCLMIALVVVGMFLLAVHLGSFLRSARLGRVGRHVWAGLGFGLVGLAVRAIWAPCGIYNGEGRGYDYLQKMCESPLEPGWFSAPGGVVPTIYWLAGSLVPSVHTPLVLSLLVSAASVFLLYVFVHDLCGSTLHAVIAASLYALFPAAVRLSCSTSLFVWLVFFWLIALHLAQHLETKSWKNIALLVCALCLATHTRHGGLLVIVPVLAVAWPVYRRNLRKAILCSLPVVVAVLPVLLDVVTRIVPEGQVLAVHRLGDLNRTTRVLFGQVNPYFYVGMVPLLAHPLVQLLGCLALMKTVNLRTGLVFGGLQVGLVYLYASETVGIFNVFRFLSTSIPFACLFGACALVALSRLAAWGRGPRTTAIVALAVLALTSIPTAREHARFVTYRTNLQDEFDTVLRGLERLPGEATVFYPERKEGGFKHPIGTCLPRLADRDVRVLRFSPERYELERTSADADRPRYVFLGLGCYATGKTRRVLREEGLLSEGAAPGAEEGGFEWLLANYPRQHEPDSAWVSGFLDHYTTEECARMIGHLDLSPVHVETFEAKPGLWFSFPARELRMGFFEIIDASPPRSAPAPGA